MSSFDVESLFQSIDIILTQRLNALSYDTTVIATIVDDSDKDKGHYIVSDDTIKFDAYTTDATYKTGEQVRVTVINGDWSQKKFIEGKYSDKEADEKAVTYIPPLGTTLQSNLSQIGQKSKWTLYTNGETYVKDPFVITIPEDSDLFNLQNKGIYDVLTIAADISTNLGNLYAGNYGLRLDLLITPESGSEYRIQKFITFDSSEMLGNPYNFIIDSHQEKRIAIADLGHVTEIVLTPYQGVVIADDGTEAPAPFLDREGNAIEQLPIYFKNVVLGFGSDLAMLDDNSLKLYTPDLPFYDYNGSFGSSANHKRLGLIWCNKTETNEYIGFSDGIVDIGDDGNIIPYDEIEYLKASNFDERLVAQTNKVGIPSDKTSLTLAANIADAVPLMKSAYENLTTGLSQVLQRFNGQIAGATSIQEKLKPLIFQYKDGDTRYPPKLVQFKDEAKEKATLLEELYTNILQYGYNTEKGLTPNNWNENWGDTDYYILFKNIMSEALGEVAAFLNFAKEETATGKVLSGYRRIYNDYEPKINTQIKLINTYIDQIPIDANASTGDLAILKSYQTKTDYAPYVKEDFSEYANRYCIYWYRYNEGYKLEYIPPMSESEWNNNKTEHSDYQAYLDYCENNNIEYKYRNFLGDNWERLTIAYDLNEVDAVVNPRPLINFGLPNTVGETVAAVTYFPPAPAESQILTRWLDPCTVDEKYQAVLFYNHEMVKSNIVVFTNSEEVPPRFKVNAGDVLRIEHDIDSREHYQVYSSANDLLNISDGSKTRQLKCFYDGVLTGDETLADAEIYWYIPVNSTMLTYDKKFLVEKQGFSTDVDGKTPYSKDGYVYFNKKIGYTRTEEIMTDEDGNEMYDSNGVALRETVITIDSEDRFFFYKIKSFYESSAQNNTILVYAYVPNKEEPTVGEINFTFGTFGSNGTKYTLAITPATDQIAVLPAENTGDDSGNLQLNLTLYNANSEKLDMTTGVGDLTGYYNLTAEWYASSTDAPALGEIKNIENSKSKSIEALGVLNTNYDTNKYAGIIKASVSYQGAGVNEATDRVITLSALYSVPYASSEDLYISGPTSIIYNSQGTISRLSEEPYCLYQHTKDGDVKATIKKESENEPVIIEPEWSIKYYNSSGEEVSDPKIINYLPKLTPDNTLQPSPLYCDYGNEVYVPVVICALDGNIVWTQPIIVIQNAYESSMLNNWNGGLVIDEANATIMTTMIGAGKKDANNQFYGVLMGDLVAGADFDSKNVNTGIHGFHAGVQSFNFSVDGTAFLGKAGRGRIIFDGNDGVIKSATTEDDSGMTIDLDDAWIEVRGPQKSTGQAMVEIDANPGSYGAYFSIKSESDNKLIHIGQNNYYLQSDNYSNRGASDDVDNPNGSGMKIDLNRGRIDAYNFRLNSKNVLINSSDNASSYLSVKDDGGNILFNVGRNSYYLKSSVDNMNINLNTGLITANKFKLDTPTLVVSSDKESENSKPYILIRTGKDDGDKDLAYFSKDKLELMSADYSDEVDKEAGMKIDFINKILNAHEFKLAATNKGGNKIIINSADNSAPVQFTTANWIQDGDDSSDEGHWDKYTSLKLLWDGTIENKYWSISSGDESGASISNIPARQMDNATTPLFMLHSGAQEAFLQMGETQITYSEDYKDKTGNLGGGQSLGPTLIFKTPTGKTTKTNVAILDGYFIVQNYMLLSKNARIYFGTSPADNGPGEYAHQFFYFDNDKNTATFFQTALTSNAMHTYTLTADMIGPIPDALGGGNALQQLYLGMSDGVKQDTWTKFIYNSSINCVAPLIVQPSGYKGTEVFKVTKNGEIIINGDIKAPDGDSTIVFKSQVEFTKDTKVTIAATQAITADATFSANTTFSEKGAVEFNGETTFNTSPTFEAGATFSGNVSLPLGSTKFGSKTLGDLAFADSVKKKLNITMTANNVSGYYKKSSSSYTTYRYKGTFSDSVYYSGSGTVTNVPYPASETGGTMDVPYSYSGWADYNYDVYEKYDPYSAVTSITMTGTTTPEFFASTDTTNSEEDITIAGTISS